MDIFLKIEIWRKEKKEEWIQNFKFKFLLIFKILIKNFKYNILNSICTDITNTTDVTITIIALNVE